ncbi:MAG: galactose-1-phosphate uridylyltransferase [Candidatus Omnitrophica bacterium]|nr:galactose-1-phosphate uridylyltransferase [Candidatus Omnitrophota bacterium]
MPELRKDPVVGRWMIIATERSKRPTDFEGGHTQPQEEGPCPFCQGHESETPPEIFSLRQPGTKPDSPGWDVRVVSNVSPILRIEGDIQRRAKGMYDTMHGLGAHEVIIETPHHARNMADLERAQIAKVLTAYAQRLNDLDRDPRFKYVLIFKNHGLAAGGGDILHTRSQLIAMAVNPKLIKEELLGAHRYFDYRERCIFCDIIQQELETGERIVAETDTMVGFCPYASPFPFEMWVLPKRHSPDFGKISEVEKWDMASVLKTALSKLSQALQDPPYNYVLHTAPFRREKLGYWKTIEEDFHWHLEIMPRLTKVAGFEWGSGVYINPTPPEEAAAYLRKLETTDGAVKARPDHG